MAGAKEELELEESADAKVNAFAVPTPKIKVKVLNKRGILVSGHPPLAMDDEADIEAPLAMVLINDGSVEPV